MTDEDLCKIGANGSIYSREYVISSLQKRYEQSEPHDWPCRDFSIRQLAASLFMINYHVHILEMNGDSYRLAHSKRRSRRARPEPPPENAPPPTDADVRK